MRWVLLAAALAVTSLQPAVAAEMDDMVLTLVSIERLETRFQKGKDVGFIEGDVTIGNDSHKAVIGIEAEREWDSNKWEGAEVHLLYRRPVSTFLDLQAGIRHDLSPDPETTHLAVGIAGLLPQWVEFDGKAYLSDDGDVSFRAEAETELFLTRRIFAQPLIELDVNATENAAREIGAGFSKLETGLRFHYLLEGGFSPYVGVNYETRLGETADYARAHGEDPDAVSFVTGLRLAY